ncbi:5-oxoprolinase-like [Mya arenaria]|uniref:5-oxoprolinase-like n=1 Tax=Mya arenaria TaxID=6604 RepID=UPI0022E3593A|nr:5-oxoprolinase-like [Mya arenaria]XP_052817624.1 5-oxoprolinase-like [Mya arenaria]XP_052817625.1 5-oxoprolinase-like [Mya arenaria]XP_052817626.1 5-oxoprolinase-like [Mya arenaria]
MTMSECQKFRFAIDRGGTFTDIWAQCPSGGVKVLKLLSEDPQNYSDAPREGIRRILEQELGHPVQADKPIDVSQIEWIRMGTTVATNALLERKGTKMALLITEGFKDLLHIGNQARPSIFDLEISTPSQLYERVVEVRERLVLHQDRCQIQKQVPIVQGKTKEQLEVWTEIDEGKLRDDLQVLRNDGFTSIAVVLMHSYTYDGHEKQVGQIAREMGFTQVSLSSDVMPMVRIVPRGYTACADAYLTPCIKTYVAGFASGFKGGLEKMHVLFMQSDGGLTPVESFIGSRAILSGPAGGVVGYALTTYNRASTMPVIGFDMGGTSTDVSRYAGQYEHVFETTTAGVTIQAPQLDINTVAAGGGSMLFFRSGMFVVGPESAGANPGPVCYMKGGPLTVTDANLCLSRLLPQYFPKIFGKTQDQPLDVTATNKAFLKLTQEVNEFLASQSASAKKVPMSVEEVAMGFIKVANETMCRPIRALTQAKGHDTSRHILACFGGAGGQHACAIARSLGMTEVFVHRYAGILSAYGMALADVVSECQEPCADDYKPESLAYLDERIRVLSAQCREELRKQGFKEDQIEMIPFLHMRYKGTDCALMCSTENNPPAEGTSQYGDFLASFNDRYYTEFGFTLPSRAIIVDDIRIRGVGKAISGENLDIPPAKGSPPVEMETECFFDDGWRKTSVYLLNNLSAGHVLEGPAIVMNGNSTILVEPTCQATVTKQGDIKIKIGTGVVEEVGKELDMIQLSIFSHRFMSIAEQMGRVLQRTSISTNIKERLDFSCAMFGPDGGLVANAPHIPVHLGAMQETVQYQMRVLGDKIFEGDVILSNHPQAGGSHLPDLTVITPVFYPGQSRPVFFVASRGHHADIGGITPGSMPPHSRYLHEEGAVFKSFKLVDNGVFQEDALKQALNDPAQYPGSSGTRNLHDNLSDLKAQVAANQKGIRLIKGLIDEYGLEVVQAYMAHIQDNAEIAVRDMLREIARKTRARTGTTHLYAQDFMDNGAEINLKINIDEQQGTAVCDFTGSSYEVYGNLNAPRAVTLSALIYCLRCMVGHDVPLNQGCLKPVQVVIPKGSILDPSENAAVVGGNVLTSQRIVDVILKAFGVCAASQGCMNNITFGDAEFGHYETVAGGAGAGPSWDGRSGVHTHMTNTRITDPEILERRYPVMLRQFHLMPGTGGGGQFRGGDGVIREYMWRKNLTLSVLTERRVFAPYGLKGGLPGEKGLNLMIYKDGRVVNVGGKTSVDCNAGDVFKLQTPGGGGYGQQENEPSKNDDGQVGEPDRKKRKVQGTSRTMVGTGSVFEYQRAQESV